MVNSAASTPSFLRDAFESYTTFSNLQKQEVQKRALKWLQSQIETELSDKTIIDRFAQKWRTGTTQSVNSDTSPLYLEKLPRSYKGSKAITAHQEEALVFMQEVVPLQMQEEFKKHWEVKTKLEVASASGTPFKIDESEKAILQEQDPEGNGTTWYQVDDKQIYYLLSSELQGNHYLVTLSEEISPQNRNTWFVSKEDVKISNI